MAPRPFDHGHQRFSPMPSPTARTLWDLAESWSISDVEALALVDYAGKIGREGKRPRFRLSTRQAQVVAFLLEIDTALRATQGDPGAWLRRKQKGPPFAGRAPLTFMTEGQLPAMAAVLRALNRDAIIGALRGG